MVLIKHIIDKLGCLDFFGNIETSIVQIIQINSANQRSDVLFWCSDKNIGLLEKIDRGTIVCSKLAYNQKKNDHCNWIVVDNPRLYFSRLVQLFFYKPPKRVGISTKAVIHYTSHIGRNCFIGDNVIIEENCSVGDDCEIGHNSVLHYGTILKNNVKIGCSNTIGGFGYGYEKNENNQYEPLPHIGNVVLEDGVEICNNCCIDRAAIGSTIVEKNVKISNLVHIGHGAVIGENSLIIANAMIAGSVVIGKNVWVAPSSSIMNKTVIGDNAIIGLSAVVIRPVKENTTVVGNPARELNCPN